MEEIKIKCSACGKVHMGLDVKATIKYKFRCKRCKHWNTGYITIMNMEDDNGKKQ